MSDAPTTVPLTTPLPPRRRLRFVKYVLLLFALGAAGFGFLLWRADRDLREAMAEADRLDPHWRLADLEAARAAIPDDENGALVVLKARSLLPAAWPPILTLPEPLPSLDERLFALPPQDQMTPEMTQELSAELAKVAPALDEALRLLDRPRGRYPAPWLTDPTAGHPFSEAPTVIALLRLYATLKAQEGNPDAALASARGVVNVARSVGDDLSPSAHYSRFLIRDRALGCVERALAQGEPSVQALIATQKFLEDEVGQPLLWHALRADRAELHEFLTWTLARRMERKARGLTLRAKVQLTLAATRARRMHPKLLRVMNAAVEAARLPPEERREALRRVEEEYAAAVGPEETLLRTHMIVGNLPCRLWGYRSGDAFLRSALAGLAAERFRLDRGRWPRALAELVPAYLAAVPLDPWGGRPFRLRRLPDGLVIYWVDADGKDTGGTLDRRFDAQGFRLWDVAHRRQHPASLSP